MAHDLPIEASLTREERLEALLGPLGHLLDGEPLGWANLANAASAIHAVTAWHWVGFYVVDAASNNLVLGPFQGPVACTRLAPGRGVCAAAWQTGQTQVVPDVEAFPGHVACSSLSRSEVVIPVKGPQGVVAVLDVDSAELGDFSEREVRALERIVETLETSWGRWTWSV